MKLNSRQVRATSGWMSTGVGPGRGGITISPCACWAGRFCWACSRTGGQMPRITRPQVYRVVCEMLLWPEGTQLRNERASRSQERCRAGCRKGRPGPPP